MNKDTKVTIDLAKFLAPIITSRDITDNYLKEAIIKANSNLVDLDFKEVEFISRSAAHELLLIKEDLLRKFLKKKDISFVNTNESVKKMLRIIAANRALPKRTKPEFKAKRADIDSLLPEASL